MGQTVKKDKNVYTSVGQMPQFPGGDEKLLEYLKKNLQYPESAKKAGTEGRVILSFIVSKNGSVYDVKVVKSLEAECDKAAINVIKNSKGWIPGKQNGSPVDVQMSIPIVFRKTK